MDLLVWGIIGAVVLIAAIVIYYLNTIVVLGNQIDNSKSQVDVQLKRRADLIPTLVETVKGYAKHEKGVFKSVTDARERMMKAGNVEDRVKASNELTGALKTLFAISENYPKLRANENFLQLQEELSSIENKVAYARQFYNDSVLRLNNMITTIPGKFFAGQRKPREYLEITVSEKAMPKVEF
ncbi:MAG: LemA family protein [Candidatus Nanoarchaeia archaeon]|jgi:LemA protein